LFLGLHVVLILDLHSAGKLFMFLLQLCERLLVRYLDLVKVAPMAYLKLLQ